MKEVRRSGAVVFACLCICWAAGSVFLALIYDYDDLALCLVFGLFSPVLGALGDLLWLSTPCGALFLAYKRLRVRRTRAAVAWLLVPVSAALLMPLGHRLGDALIFKLHESQYQFVVRQAVAGHCSPPDGGRWPVAVDFLQCKPPVIVIFSWGGFLSSWEGVVYDAADQITKPPALRQKAWRASNVGSVLDYSGATQSLGGHYFFGSGTYP